MSTALRTLAAFKQHIDAGVAPGGQLCISVGGKLVLDAAYGRLAPGGAEVTRETIYDLASLTKVLATTYFVARGDLDVDRVQNELEHCAGRAAHRLFPGPDVVAQAAAEPLEYEPRSKAIYSDLGFIIMGSQLPLRDITRDKFGVFYAHERRLSDVFAPTPFEGVVHDDNARTMGGIAGHAGLFGRGRDVLTLGEKWLAAWHGTDESFLPQATVRRFWTRSTVPGSTRALGWDTPSQSGSTTGDVWPEDAVGHLGFTGTSLWIAPRQSLVVAMLTNRVLLGSDVKPMRREVHASAWQELTT